MTKGIRENTPLYFTREGRELIREIRKKYNLSQREVGERMNLGGKSPQTRISSWEIGKTGIPKALFEKLYEALNSDPALNFLLDPEEGSPYFARRGDLNALDAILTEEIIDFKKKLREEESLILKPFYYNLLRTYSKLSAKERKSLVSDLEKLIESYSQENENE